MKVIICGAGSGWLADRAPSCRVRTQRRDGRRQQRRTGAARHRHLGRPGHCRISRATRTSWNGQGRADADMVIAATHSDEVNMVTCQVAHSVFAVQRKIARLRQQSISTRSILIYTAAITCHRCGDQPENEVAEAALQRLAAPAAFDTERFWKAKRTLLGITIEDDCPVVNTPLRQLTDLFSTLRAVVVGIRRDGTLFAPDAATNFSSAMIAMCYRNRRHAAHAWKFWQDPSANRNVVVIGGRQCGSCGGQALESRTDRVRMRKVIERDRRCAETARRAGATIVLNGDGLDALLLDEANIAGPTLFWP